MIGAQKLFDEMPQRGVLILALIMLLIFFIHVFHGMLKTFLWKFLRCDARIKIHVFFAAYSSSKQAVESSSSGDEPLSVLPCLCGQGSTDDELTPTCVSSLLGIQIDSVAAGPWHTICISSDGDVYAFGGYQFGQLGTKTDHVPDSEH